MGAATNGYVPWSPEDSTKFENLAKGFANSGLSQRKWAEKVVGQFPGRTTKSLIERLCRVQKAVAEKVAEQKQELPPAAKTPSTTPSPSTATPPPTPPPSAPPAPPIAAAVIRPTGPAAPAPRSLPQPSGTTAVSRAALAGYTLPANPSSVKFLDINVSYDAVVLKILDSGVIVEVLVGDYDTGRIFTGFCHVTEIWSHAFHYLPDEWFDEGEQVKVQYIQRNQKGYLFSMRKANYKPFAKRGKYANLPDEESNTTLTTPPRPQNPTMAEAFKEALDRKGKDEPITPAPAQSPAPVAPSQPATAPSVQAKLPLPTGNPVERMDDMIAGLAGLWNEMRGKYGTDPKVAEQLAAAKEAIKDAHQALTQDFDSKKAVLILGMFLNG